VSGWLLSLSALRTPLRSGSVAAYLGGAKQKHSACQTPLTVPMVVPFGHLADTAAGVCAQRVTA
jgi:hypothetical protein